MSELWMWLFVAVALAGNYAVVKKQRWGFLAWMVSNVAWASYDFYKEAYAQTFLMSVYFLLAIWGWHAWKQGKA